MNSKLKLLLVSMVMSISVSAKDWTGSLFPTFELKNQNNEVITNKNFSDKWVVYYFYPKDNTPGCSIEAENFATRYPELLKMGLDVVGISLDDVDSHKSFAGTYKVKFNLLADVDKQLSKQMDIVNYLPWPYTRRETFIVDDKGNIVKHYKDVDPSTHVEQIVIDFKALKATLK
ncbi:MAG: peroxiredoxin [Kangiellaceae bacterium]|jgi:peroxiredoxin Q/BCP|nr:peroxiredoxin [Kangiellaceae bacterium]